MYNAVAILASANDVAGWIMVLRFKPEALIHKIEQAVEDTRAAGRAGSPRGSGGLFRFQEDGLGLWIAVFRATAVRERRSFQTTVLSKWFLPWNEINP